MWSEITAKCRSTKQHAVAVAYLGVGSHERLPLTKGDILVVNGSDHSFGTGAVNPGSLARYLSAGVEISSDPTLHAKVFVLGNTAFVGSANNSQASEKELNEAMVRTTDAGVVSASRKFVERVAGEGEAVTDEFLARAHSLWKPPERGGGHEPRDRGPLKPVPDEPFRLVVVETVPWEPGEKDTAVIERIEDEVIRRVPSAYATTYNYFRDVSVRVGDVLVLAWKPKVEPYLAPPQVVVHVEKVKGRWPHDIVFTRYSTELEEVPLPDDCTKLLPGGERSQRLIKRPEDRKKLLALWELDDPGSP